MKVNIKDVKVIYTDDTEELKKRYAKVTAKIIIGRISDEKIEDLIEKLKG